MSRETHAQEYAQEGSFKTFFLSVTLAAAVLLVDYVTGKEIEFPILYVVPVSMAAWKEQRVLAYGLAAALSLVRVGFHIPWNEMQSPLRVWLNGSVILASLALYAYLVIRTARQTRELRKDVQMLEGILPICASCKKIRNEHGEYEQIETYISDHSEAQFSHGLCSECAKKLYGELE